jgi:hypothetical protein
MNARAHGVIVWWPLDLQVSYNAFAWRAQNPSWVMYRKSSPQAFRLLPEASAEVGTSGCGKARQMIDKQFLCF